MMLPSKIQFDSLKIKQLSVEELLQLLRDTDLGTTGTAAGASWPRYQAEAVPMQKEAAQCPPGARPSAPI
jgi:hypothetical protein